MLKNSYFSIESKTANEDGSITFLVCLNPDHEVYKGHFPGMPVCPGVCNIQMIRECAEEHIGKKLSITSIKQCRFDALVSPDEITQLGITLAFTPDGDTAYTVKGSLQNRDQSTTFIEYKGVFQLAQ